MFFVGMYVYKLYIFDIVKLCTTICMCLLVWIIVMDWCTVSFLGLPFSCTPFVEYDLSNFLWRFWIFPGVLTGSKLHFLSPYRAFASCSLQVICSGSCGYLPVTLCKSFWFPPGITCSPTVKLTVTLCQKQSLSNQSITPGLPFQKPIDIFFYCTELINYIL